MAERRDSDVTVIETEGGSGFKWFVIGALVGAGVGLLFAPQSGERTRRSLTRRAKKLRAQAEDKFEELTDGLEERGRHLAESVEDWADDVTDDVQKGKRKVEKTAHAAREELERRLSSARRRRANIAADGVAEDDDADD